MARKAVVQSESTDVISYFKKELDSVDDFEDVEGFISTGSTLLDYCIANMANGGIPKGRIIEIAGNEATGKSLISYHILANTQKKGGIAVYIDTERSKSKQFMTRMGINTKKLIVPKRTPRTIEEVFDYIESIIKITREKFPGKEVPVVVVWDSVAASVAHEDIEVNNTDVSRLGAEARAMSRSLRKMIASLDDGYVTLVCVNQIRKKIGVSFGNDNTTSHGKALPFYCSVRIKLKIVSKIKDKTDTIVGVWVEALVDKNKVGPGWRSVRFPVMFDWGVDDIRSVMEFCKTKGLVKTAGAWSKIKVNGQEITFQGPAGWRDLLKTNPDAKKTVSDFLANKCIRTYETKPEDLDLTYDAILAASLEDNKSATVSDR